MFRSFEDAELFLVDVIQKTEAGEIPWRKNGSGDFVEEGSDYKPSFHLFGRNPPELILRATNDDYDLVISERADIRHGPSLENLSKAILKKLRILL